MEYRRVQAKGFTRVVLTLYNWVSRYGELPTRALWWLLGVLAAPALLYPFTGFRFQGVETRLLLRFEWSNFGPTVVSLLKAILFSLAGLVSGYFRIQSEMLGSASA